MASLPSCFCVVELEAIVLFPTVATFEALAEQQRPVWFIPYSYPSAAFFSYAFVLPTNGVIFKVTLPPLPTEQMNLLFKGA